MESADSITKTRTIGKRFSGRTAIVLCLLLVAGVMQGQKKELKKAVHAIQSGWLSELNSTRKNTPPYTGISGLMYKDSLLVGQDAIEGMWKRLNGEDRILKYDTITFFQLYENQMLVHGVYTTAGGTKIPGVIAWKYDQRWYKAFEAVAPKSDRMGDHKTEIGLLRSSWELYANQHRPDLIVKNIFSSKGKYFYRGKVHKAMEIAEAYGYMRDKSYSINLTPRKIIPFNDRLVCEIGIYDAGGKGLYVLLWGMEGDDWKLLLDFNF
ncbi:hypothetical protein [Muriicola jejuensis]|nr:hypothetical protein [Muriicola jejuensis]